MLTVDALILELIETGHQASPEELATIIAHVAQAPFATYQARVPIKLHRAMVSLGRILPPKLSSLAIHLLKRVDEEQQWPVGTSEQQYIADLHRTVAHPDVQIWTYRYFTQPFVGFLAPSHVQNASRLEKCIFVAYSPVYGTLTTGYQASAIAEVFTEGYTDVMRQR
jgi:hypothetical protein